MFILSLTKWKLGNLFWDFFSLAGKKADSITEDILQNLNEHGLDISLCRSQGYDNAATMSGIHSGVQTRIKKINSKALFVPCANHSLNLCGIHSFASVPSCVTFFATMEMIYTFFSGSTHRWDILLKHVNVTVKRLSETRWSSHHDAIKPVKKHLKEITEALDELCDPSENLDTRGSAEVTLNAMSDFSFMCYLHLWNEVLQEVNHTQKYLQIEGISFEKCVIKLRSLKLFLVQERSNIVKRAIAYATTICEEMGISIEKRGRIRKKKLMPGETAEDSGLTLKQEIERAMLECIDRFHVEINTRSKSMEQILSIFQVILSENLISSSEKELQNLAQHLTQTFDEISSEEIIIEILRLRRHLEAAQINEDTAKWSALKNLKFIVDMEICETVPNLYLALRYLLTISVSVASCERSFSKLKLIKTYLRSTMSQSRLTHLALLSIEHKIAKDLDFEGVIKKFANLKSRKMKF